MPVCRAGQSGAASCNESLAPVLATSIEVEFVIPFLLVFYEVGRTIHRGLRDPEFRQICIMAGFVLSLGTFFYWRVEHWSLVDSFYFSVVTLATVGFGDLHPSSAASKLFTAAYIIVGVGILVAFYSRLAFRILSERNRGRPLSPLPRTGYKRMPHRRWRVHSRSIEMPSRAVRTRSADRGESSENA